MKITYEDWAVEALSELGYPVTMHNRRAMIAWLAMEGSVYRWNPLGCTLKLPGSITMNSDGVQAYLSSADGLEAFRRTILTRGFFRYWAIRRKLKHSAPVADTLLAIERSAWGTHFSPSIDAMVQSVRNNYHLYATKLVAGSS